MSPVPVPPTATKAKPYVCLTCTRPFARLEHLKRHERSHTKEKPFQCIQAGNIPGCGRCFARRDLLLRHQQKIHLSPNTNKRRRLSTNSIVSTTSVASNPSNTSTDVSGPNPSDMRFTIAVPNFDDLTNFSAGTVNPSSLHSPQSSTPAIQIPELNSCFYATERLLPLDYSQFDSSWLSSSWSGELSSSPVETDNALSPNSLGAASSYTESMGPASHPTPATCSNLNLFAPAFYGSEQQQQSDDFILPAICSTYPTQQQDAYLSQHFTTGYVF